MEQTDGAAAAESAPAASSAVANQPRLAFLPWLEGTAFSGWVNKSAVGYPTLLCLHIIGLAILVGTLLMVDLRLLNVVTGIPSAALLTMIRFASAGFIINVASGLALFAAQATMMAANVPFLTKITLILLGAITTVLIQRRLRSSSGGWDETSTPGSALRKLAVLSILIWVGVIAAGRMIPYLGQY